MKKTYKILLFVLLFACFLVGCGEKPTPEPDPGTTEDWDSKTLEAVELDKESFEATYDIDDFKVELLKLNLSYTDGTSRLLPCGESNFDENDYKKLASPGNKKVVVIYDVNGFYFESDPVTVKIVDYSVYDENLNRNNDYNCVVKVIRNLKTNKLEFIVDPKTGFAGMQVKYVFDKGKLNLTNFVLNPESKGYGKCTFDEANQTLTVEFVASENITTETVLFSCDWSGDFRFSGLKADINYPNKAYTINGETTEKMMNVLYHVSQK